MNDPQSVLTFNGTSDYIEVPYTPDLNPAQFTLSCWVKVTGNPGQWRSLFTSRIGIPLSGYILYATTANRWAFWLGGGGSWNPLNGPAVAIDAWTHVAATYDGSTTRLYINGQSVGTPVAASLRLNDTYPLRIGAGITEGAAGYFLKGQMVEVRLWDRARSQTEIEQGKGTRLSGSEAGLVGYWPLDDGSGTTARDLTANGNAGTLNGGTWGQEVLDFLQPLVILTATDTSTISTATGTITTSSDTFTITATDTIATDNLILTSDNLVLNANAVVFANAAMPVQPSLPVLSANGANGTIDCGSGIDLANKSFTVEGWVKRTATDQFNYIFQQGPSVTNQGLHIGFRNTNVFTFAFYANDLNTASAYTDSEWHHWSCVYDANSKRRTIYRDGVEVASDVSPADYQGTGIFHLGSFAGGAATFFAGQLAELRVWGRDRTQAEIQAQMNRRLVGDEADLIAYWPLNELVETFIKDRSGNGHHGTMTGGVTGTLGSVPLKIVQPVLQLLLPALKFDGTARYVDCGSGLDLTTSNTTSFTIEAYVKHEESSQNQMFFCQGQRNPSQGLYLGFRASNVFTFSFWGNEFDTPVACTDACWHHWSCTYSVGGNERIIYCDGEEVARNTETASYQGTGNVYLGFGAGDPGTGDMEWFFRGHLAEVRVWKTVRTQAEIQASLNRSLSGYEGALVAYWPLHEGTGTTVMDKTRRGHDGTISGAGWTKLERSPGTGLADYGYWYRWQQNLPLQIKPVDRPSFSRGRIWA